MKTTRGQACKGGVIASTSLIGTMKLALLKNKQTNIKNIPSKFEIVIHKCKPNHSEVGMGKLKVKIIFP